MKLNEELTKIALGAEMAERLMQASKNYGKIPLNSVKTDSAKKMFDLHFRASNKALGAIRSGGSPKLPLFDALGEAAYAKSRGFETASDEIHRRVRGSNMILTHDSFDLPAAGDLRVPSS